MGMRGWMMWSFSLGLSGCGAEDRGLSFHFLFNK